MPNRLVFGVSSVQARNIHALLLRDMMMRSVWNNVGFIWAFLEPMILTVGVYGVWSLVGASKHGFGVAELVLTGYLPLTLWRHLSNSPVHLFRHNAPLLYHRHVTLFDLIAKPGKGLELIGTTAALVVIYSVLNLCGIVDQIQRPDLLLMGWFMMAWIGAAAGVRNCRFN